MAHSGTLCNDFPDRPFRAGLSVFPNADCAERTCDGVPCGQPDIQLQDGSFRRDNWIRSWVITQLLTQARVDACDLPYGARDNRGWWADSIRNVNFTSGSKLWSLSWSRSVNETLTKARLYTEEALQPLLAWNIAETINVTAKYNGQQTIEIQVDVGGPSTGKTRTTLVGVTLPDMSWLWKTETGAI